MLPAAARRFFTNQRFGAEAALFFLVVLAYLPALRGGFIWDDDAHLTHNACIVGSAGFAGI